MWTTPKSLLVRIVSIALLVAGCAGNGWRSQTVVHATYVTDKEAQSDSNGVNPADPFAVHTGNEAQQAFAGMVPVCTIVELDGGQLFEIPGTDATGYLTPGASVQLYSARSADGKDYYSLRMDGEKVWEVRSIARPETQSC